VTRLSDEYFKRDLSEAEEQQLSDELASSSEEAQHMAKRMGELYAQTGLPEPVWHDKPLPSSLIPGQVGILKKLLIPGLILALSGVLCYWGYRCLNRPSAGLMPPAGPSESLTQPPASQPDSMKNTDATIPTVKKSSAVQNRVTTVTAPAKAAPKAAGSVGQSPSTSASAGQPGVPPAPAAPGRTYQELSVVVDLPQSALATVRVYDKSNIEIRLLFAGILPQGQRTFAWDGKDEAGLVAPPGVYFIEIKSGEKVMRQEVHVEADQDR
jgi:hypothetical protein